MKKFILLLPALFILTACFWKAGEKTIEIKSDTESAVLQIAKSALPSGTSASDISITALTSEDIPFQISGVTLTGFKLEPDGLEFDETAYLTMPIDGDFPLYFHWYDDTFEPVNGAEYIVNGDQKSVKVPVTHFSAIIEGVFGTDSLNPMFDIKASAADAEVGDAVSATATIAIAFPTYTVNYESGNSVEYKLVEGTQTIKGHMYGENVSPGLSVSDMPPKSAFGQSYTVKTDKFTCKEEGAGSVVFDFVITWQFTYADIIGTLIDSAIGARETDYHVTITVPFNCKAKKKCGNYKAKGDEACDRTDLKGKTCKDLGYDSGYLLCDKKCEYDTGSCFNSKKISCSDDRFSEESKGLSKDQFICSDDCSEGMKCNTETCACEYEEAAPKVSCSENRFSEESKQYSNFTCSDDCSEGMYCDTTTCTCKKTDETTTGGFEKFTPPSLYIPVGTK